MSPPAAPVLVVDHVRRSFGEVHAVVDASLSLSSGSVTALVGPNGSGKTTLLLMLAGLLAPDAGSIHVGGLTFTEHGPQARRLVGWMPDTFGTWDTLTCTEILTTFAAAYRMGPEEAGRRAEELLAVVHLAEYAGSPARVLSRGQKQRLGLARALVHSPSVLLLDEPASGMDPQSRHELRSLVRELAAGGVAVLISSHVLTELEEMVDGAVFLQRGVTSLAPVGRASLALPWRIRVLDGAAFVSWAATVGLPYSHEDDGAASASPQRTFRIVLPDETQAAALVRDAVAAGVAISQIAPAVGRLEHAYLAMGADRR